jgi:hypothetical protein
MKWMTWFDQFMLEINRPCVFVLHELKTAWKNGRTPKDVAFANDELAREYDILEECEAA